MSLGAQEPAYEVLRVSAPASADLELRGLARSHLAASNAPYRSRSYRAPLALVAWADGPVGADIERIGPLGRRFAESVCTPAERDRFDSKLEDPQFVTSLWSGKEALAKALGDALAYDPQRLESPLGWERGTAGGWRARELRPEPGYVAWLVWRVSAAVQA